MKSLLSEALTVIQHPWWFFWNERSWKQCWRQPVGRPEARLPPGVFSVFPPEEPHSPPLSTKVRCACPGCFHHECAAYGDTRTRMTSHNNVFAFLRFRELLSRSSLKKTKTPVPFPHDWPSAHNNCTFTSRSHKVHQCSCTTLQCLGRVLLSPAPQPGPPQQLWDSLEFVSALVLTATSQPLSKKACTL